MTKEQLKLLADFFRDDQDFLQRGDVFHIGPLTGNALLALWNDYRRISKDGTARKEDEKDT